MSLQMVLKFQEFREQVLVHATAHQAEQELADKVGQEMHVVHTLCNHTDTVLQQLRGQIRTDAINSCMTELAHHACLHVCEVKWSSSVVQRFYQMVPHQ